MCLYLAPSMWQKLEPFSLTQSWVAAAVYRFQPELWQRSGSSGVGSCLSKPDASLFFWCWAGCAPGLHPLEQSNLTSAGCSQEVSGTEPAQIKVNEFLKVSKWVIMILNNFSESEAGICPHQWQKTKWQLLDFFLKIKSLYWTHYIMFLKIFQLYPQKLMFFPKSGQNTLWYKWMYDLCSLNLLICTCWTWPRARGVAWVKTSMWML